ncbi:MAG: TonB-dependent receptor plug domain-containing protein, partial [Pseudomonadota bacterium]
MNYQWFAVAALGAVSVVAAAQEAAVDDRGNELDQITIIGSADDLVETTGAAVVIGADDLALFEHADVQRILRQVPGVSIQTEDGYGLRPNLSIRGTATERSGRITLLEDNVLIAPAPYSAPSAYYFPTAGRMSEVEVLKGSASVRQGPYTVGGAMNFLSVPIPTRRSGFVNAEFGEDATTRLHATYGDSQTRYGWLVEGHLWNSDGFQDIARSDRDTGLDKDDWMAKFRLNSDPAAAIYQQLDIKLQFATENSDQSYLGLTDADFAADPYVRYGLSELDNIDTEHEQVILRYAAEFGNGTVASVTAYNNTHERAWFKTEGIDIDGSASADEFSRTSWFSVVQGINTGNGIAGASAAELQAILDGGDTAPGAIQLRNNAREYYSRGIEVGLTWQLDAFGARHEFDAGVRYHEDEEDRLQRNSSYTQTGGELMLADLGSLGNAGNRLQEARAISLYLTDRIDFGRLVLTPGMRFEQIDQERTRWETRSGRSANP